MVRDLPRFRLYRLDDEDREVPVVDETLERAVLDHSALARSSELADLLRSAPSSLRWRVEGVRSVEGPSEALLRWLERADVAERPDWPVARLGGFKWSAQRARQVSPLV